MERRVHAAATRYHQRVDGGRVGGGYSGARVHGQAAADVTAPAVGATISHRYSPVSLDAFWNTSYGPTRSSDSKPS